MNERKLLSSLRECISTLGSVSGQGAVYHPLGTQSLVANGEVCAFCAYCQKHGSVGPYCRYACHSSAMQTLTSGEPHYQRCWAGLLYVTVAVAPGGEYAGGISMGGFYAEGEKDAITAGLDQRLAVIPRTETKPFLARLDSLREIAPSALRGLGLFLMETTFTSGVNSSQWFRKRHADYVQQREIAEAYADLQQENVTPPDIMSDTYQLMSYMHRHDREGAMQFISRYLAKLLLVSNWNLNKLRAHVRVLMAVITSQDVLEGMDWATAMRREWLFMNRIEKAADTETICSEVAELVLQHFGQVDTHTTGERTLGDRVAEWLERHCQERATLEDAARAVGASVSTIAHQLPEETGKTFGQLRRETRVAQAKRLLATSTMGISAIADACGFADQSHFTRVFKSEISLTPGKFRKMLKQFEKEHDEATG